MKDSGSGVTAQGYVVTIDENFSAVMLSTSNDARGDIVGLAPAAVTANYYYWALRNGTDNIQVLASCAANVRINTTATAGALDDDGTTGAMQVEGIYLTTARGGTAGTAQGVLNYPIIGVTL